MALPLNQVYVSMIRSFKADCEQLIEKFIEKRSEDFRDFVPLWKAFKFNLIYEKYARDGLLYDLKEDSLQIAKTIMLNVHFVGGLFLLYGLYYVQEDPRPNIRIEYHEFDKMIKLLREERKTLVETCQPGYMFAKLMKNSAFAFVRFSRDFSMEGQNRARLVFNDRLPLVGDEEKKVDGKEWLHGLLERLDVIDELKHVEKEYFKKKQKLKEEHPQLNLALDMVPDDFISGLERFLTHTDTFSEQPVEENTDSPQMDLALDVASDATGHSTKESIGSRRRKLKISNMEIKSLYPRGRQEEESLEAGISSPPRPRFKRVRKKRGAPGGQRKLYFKVLMNESESSDSESESDDPTSSLRAAKK